ncbi:hypothetical protein PHYBOEH_005030 [Phytophthora boehmeriae]|uniref:Uncharacterized protein n=1 Tax=Phytophthora boehmeriae TaxID=109152 RepID=A0A8T1WQB5_9STRA|nr:hypothetical protein PHYBOEH_005030 [Phytophthora boehmeriae]
MRLTWRFSFAVAAISVSLLLPGASATPLEYNPYTTSSSASSLSHSNPAFGGVAADTGASTITYEERSYAEDTASKVAVKTSTSTSTTFNNSAATNGSVLGLVHNRKLQQSNTDIQKIETFFGTSLERNLKKLASSAAFHVIPWPSSYWAMYLDGINYRWNPNEPSATEKYANAFGLDANTLMTSVSQDTGILSMASTKTSCWSDWDCAGQNDGSTCARRDGEWQGYCIPSWYGICHAWAPAAILEPEPNCAIEHNGVTFHPMDIKALLSEVYDGANIGTIFTGARFNGPDSDAATDQYGRYTDASHRDLGPGFMHLALTNIIGRFNTSVVMDVKADAEVWNQPIYSYEVHTQTEMTPSEAASQYYGQSIYPFNSAAQRIMYTETSITWVLESYEDGGLVASGRAASYMNTQSYTYLLELDNDYNILGGEWVGNSNSDHPDFLWFPQARPDLSTVTEVGISYQNVRTLLEKATSC